MLHQSTLIAAVGRAIEGQRIWFLAASQAEARESFLAAPDDLPGASYRRTNGSEAILFPNGGVINFRSARSNGREFSADRIYAPSSISEDALANVIPALATSKDGAVIYY